MDAAPLPELGLLRQRSTYSLTGFDASLFVKKPQIARLLCAQGAYEVTLAVAQADLEMGALGGFYSLSGEQAMTRSDLILGAES